MAIKITVIILFYIFTGGAYVNEVFPEHLKFCSNLSSNLNAYVLIPIYPLAPNNTYETTYDLILSLYKDIVRESTTELIMMGDSAGGGFSIAFCQYIKSLDIKEPNRLICLSPWVDVSMSGNEYACYEKYDPLLGVNGLKEMGKVWAGGISTKVPKVSPLFGDSAGLPDTLIFVGTHEVFYPDILEFYSQLKKSNVKVELVIENKMNHVYPLYPIPEAKKAMDKIVDTISG